MTLSEKSAYLKGLMEGMKLDTEDGAGKMIAAIVDLLGDLSKKVENIEDTTIAISDELDEIEDDLDAIDDFIADLDEDDDFDYYDDEDDDYEEDEDFDEFDEEDDSSADEDEDDYDFGDETIYEVQCKCGEIIDFDEETLERGSMVCPNCGETLEFTTEEDEDEN